MATFLEFLEGDEWADSFKSYLISKGKSAIAKVDRAMGVDPNDFNRDTFWHIKRTCDNERCRNTPLDDPNGPICGRCADYKEWKHFPKGQEAFKHKRSVMLREKQKVAIFEYIRETCDNRDCYSASHKDIDAYVCDRCTDLREHHLEEMRVELELREDKEFRAFMCEKWKHPDNCKESHNIMPKRYRISGIGNFSCRPCTCFLDWSVDAADSCPCGKQTSVYKGLRQAYQTWKNVETEHLKMLAHFKSRCKGRFYRYPGPSCKEISTGKITRWERPEDLEKVPPKWCSCGEILHSRGLSHTKCSNYAKNKKEWDEEVSKWDEVMDFMRGTCKNVPCYFSRGEFTHDYRKPVYCLSCHDALERNYDGIKRQMEESKYGEKYQPDLASLILHFPREFTDSVGKNASKVQQLAEKFYVKIQVYDGWIRIKGDRAKAAAAKAYINMTLQSHTIGAKKRNQEKGEDTKLSRQIKASPPAGTESERETVTAADQLRAYAKLEAEHKRNNLPPVYREEDSTAANGNQHGGAIGQQIRAFDKLAKEDTRSTSGAKDQQTRAFDKLAREDTRIPSGVKDRQVRALDKLAKEDTRNTSGARDQQTRAFDKLAKEDTRNTSGVKDQQRAFDKLAKEDSRNIYGAHHQQARAFDKLAREDSRNSAVVTGRKSSGNNAHEDQARALDKLAREDSRNSDIASRIRSSVTNAYDNQARALDKLAREDSRNSSSANGRKSSGTNAYDNQARALDKLAKEDSRNSANPKARHSSGNNAYDNQARALDKLAREDSRNPSASGRKPSGANAHDNQTRALDKLARENRRHSTMSPDQSSGNNAHADQARALDKIAKERRRNSALPSVVMGTNAHGQQARALDKLAWEKKRNSALPPLPVEARQSQYIPGGFPDDNEEEEYASPSAVVPTRPANAMRSMPGGFPDDEEEEEFIGIRTGRVLRLPHRGMSSQHVPGSFDDEDIPDGPPPAYAP